VRVGRPQRRGTAAWLVSRDSPPQRPCTYTRGPIAHRNLARPAHMHSFTTRRAPPSTPSPSCRLPTRVRPLPPPQHDSHRSSRTTHVAPWQPRAAAAGTRCWQLPRRGWTAPAAGRRPTPCRHWQWKWRRTARWAGQQLTSSRGTDQPMGQRVALGAHAEPHSPRQPGCVARGSPWAPLRPERRPGRSAPRARRRAPSQARAPPAALRQPRRGRCVAVPPRRAAG
jgi:hypothetical protein